MIIIDSSLWLEYFINTDNAKIIDKLLSAPETIILPSIIITEVYKKLSTELNEGIARTYTAQFRAYNVVDLDFDLAVSSAMYGKQYKLPLADSIIYATTMKFDAELYTLDKHFERLRNVKYLKKNK